MIRYGLFAGIAAGLICIATPATAQSCAGSPFMVFFDSGSDTLSPTATQILENVAAIHAACAQAQVMIAGHTDRHGTDLSNMQLAQRRADGVRAYLEGHGIAASIVTTQAFGESRPLVDTADGVREPQNNRVEINFASE